MDGRFVGLLGLITIALLTLGCAALSMMEDRLHKEGSTGRWGMVAIGSFCLAFFMGGLLWYLSKAGGS